MRKLLIPGLIASFAIVQPIAASEMLSSIQRSQNPAEVIERFLCPSGTFDSGEARQFLLNLKKEVKELHGIDLDLKSIVDEAIKIMLHTGQFSEVEILTAREFYSELIEPIAKSSNAWHFGKKKKNKKNKSQELVLPDKMAGGFMCILGGAILCILPFGVTQGIGTGLITTGVAVIIESSVSGEKPHYINKETGERTPVFPNPDSGIGTGVQF
jgi:hypothetical protein